MTKNAYPAKIAQALRDKRSGAGIHSGRTEIAHRCLQRPNYKTVKILAGRGFALCGRSGIWLAKEGDMLTCLQKITETNFKLEEVKSRHYKASRPCVIIKNSQEDRI